MTIENKKRTILLTGATGLVGSYLLKILLQNNHKVYCLARSKKNKNAKQRVIDILNFWDKKIYPKHARNLIILEGDIAQKDLGLNKKDKNLLKKYVQEIFHSAAITNLNAHITEIRKTNVTGTRNIFNLALELKKTGKLIKINHISTAYVYGDYQGKFTENDLDVKQKFKTNYEQTKFESEKIVREYRKKGLWADIFRPSMILGESLSGKTFQFKHIYQVLNLCKLELFDTLPVSQGNVSLVPIDITAKTIYLLTNKSERKNSTYHIFCEKLSSIRDILLLGSRIMKFRMPKIVSLSKFNFGKLTTVQKNILNNLFDSINFRIKLKSQKTNNLLKRYNYQIPQTSSTILTRMIRYSNKRQK